VLEPPMQEARGMTRHAISAATPSPHEVRLNSRHPENCVPSEIPCSNDRSRPAPVRFAAASARCRQGETA